MLHLIGVALGLEGVIVFVSQRVSVSDSLQPRYPFGYARSVLGVSTLSASPLVLHFKRVQCPNLFCFAEMHESLIATGFFLWTARLILYRSKKLAVGRR